MNAWRLADPRVKAAGLLLLVAALAALAWLLPRVPQPQRYHHFADPYVCFGLPRCLDISSNALILLAGAAGLRFLRSAAARRAFIEPAERRPYTLFFLATLLVALSSGYYHLAPDNERLAWDRAALALALMSWLSANLCERVHPSAGLRLLPLLLWLYRPRYSGDKDVLAITGLYLLALLGVLAPPSRAAEFFDLWGLAVKPASIAGPLTYGMTSWVTGGDHRQSMLISGRYFLVGLVLLRGVNPARGRQTALRSDRLSRRGNVPNR